MKKSHKKDFNVDAEILIALKRKQPQSFYKNIPLLKKRKILRETKKAFAWYDYVEQPSRWKRVVDEFAVKGANLVEITLQKASDDSRDPITGWFKFRHDTEYTAKVIIVLRSAPDLLRIAKDFESRFKDEFENKEFTGVVFDAGFY